MRSGLTHALSASLIILPGGLAAQEVALRTYFNVPIDVNAATLTYSNSGGLIWLDPAIPIADLDADTRIGIASYHRTFGFLGRQARFGAVLPWVDGSWSGRLNNIPSSRQTSGIGDMRLGIHWNFKGAPALDAIRFASHVPERIFGASLTLTLPTGDYDSTELLNLGSNRWTLRTEIGMSQPLGRWTAELAATAWLFGDNHDFLGGLTLEQEELWVVKGGFSYSFNRPGMWLGLGLGYGTGGTTIVDGLRRQTRQENWRFAMAFSYPVARRHGIGMALASGITKKAGADFDAIQIFYRYVWGRGTNPVTSPRPRAREEIG